MVSSAPELVRFRVSTPDPEEAHEFMRQTYANHTLSLSGDRDHFEFSAGGVQEERFGIDRLRHSMSLDTDVDPYGALMFLHIRGGVMSMADQHTQVTSRSGEVMLANATDEYHAWWAERVDMSIIRLDVTATQEIAAELTDTPAGRVRFDLTKPIDQARAAHWLGTVHYVNTNVFEAPIVADNPLIRSQAFRSLVVSALNAFPNSTMRGDFAGTQSSHAPSAVLRALAFIDAFAGEDISVLDIADAAGVSPRTLQLAFRRHRDTTPMSYLRQVRLHRAHADLRAADPRGTSVAVVARRWGFLHGGHFARIYQQEYDCLPQDTLLS